MSYETAPTEFRGKIWIYAVPAAIFGGLGVFSLVMGTLFLFGLMKRANGTPPTDAGVALSIMSTPLLLVSALAVFNVIARRRPVVRIRLEGIEINLIGCSTLDRVPLVPTLIRVAWAILSLQGFKQQLVCIPWEEFREVHISGLPMVRRLTIVGSVMRADSADGELRVCVADRVSFVDGVFVSSLDEVAAAIRAYSQNVRARVRLQNT